MRQTRSDVIGAAHQMILVRDIKVPQDSMKKLCAVVKIEDIFVASFDIDCETAGANRFGVGYRKIGGIIVSEERCVALRTDQSVRARIAARLQN